MIITWYGHRCIRIEAKEGSVLIDPFEKKSGLRGPRLSDDIILVSSFVVPDGVESQISDETLFIHGPGEYERKGVVVRGIQAYRDNQNGAELGLATIYIVVADDVSVCHLGAIGQGALTDEQAEAIGDPDILIVPAGGQGALNPRAAAQLCNQIEPKIIIPVQFALPDVACDAEKVEKFVKETGLLPEKEEKLRIAKKQLPTDRTNLVILSV